MVMFLIEPTQIRNDQVQRVDTTCWLADNIHQFTVMDRADVCIVEVTTDHEATIQVFAFEDSYRVCNVLQQPFPCTRLGRIIDRSYNDAQYFTGQAVRAELHPYALQLMRSLNIQMLGSYTQRKLCCLASLAVTAGARFPGNPRPLTSFSGFPHPNLHSPRRCQASNTYPVAICLLQRVRWKCKAFSVNWFLINAGCIIQSSYPLDMIARHWYRAGVP